MNIKQKNLIVIFVMLFCIFNTKDKNINIGIADAIKYTTKSGVHRFSTNFKLNLKKHYFSEIKQNKSLFLFKFKPRLVLVPGKYAEIVIEPQVAKKFKLRSLKKKIEKRKRKHGRRKKNKKKIRRTTNLKRINKVIPMSMNQAYVIVRPTSFLSLSLGRQEISFDAPIFIAGKNQNKLNDSLDAIRIKIKYNKSNWTEFFICSIASKTQLFKGNIYITGLYNNMEIGKYIKNISFFIISKFSSLKNVNPLINLGIKLKTRIRNLEYKLLLINQIEKGKSSKEYNMEISYTISKLFTKPKLSFIFFGNCEDYKKLYPTINKWLGYINTYSKKNTNGISFQVNSKITNWFKAKIDLIYMSRNSSPRNENKINKNIKLLERHSNKRTISSELNITSVLDINKNLSLIAGLTMIKPRSDLKAKIGSYKIPVMWFMQISTKM